MKHKALFDFDTRLSNSKLPVPDYIKQSQVHLTQLERDCHININPINFTFFKHTTKCTFSFFQNKYSNDVEKIDD